MILLVLGNLFSFLTIIICLIDINTLNSQLKNYDDETFARLEPVLEKIREKSKALASNLERCFHKFRDTDRYLRVFNGEEVAVKESELQGEEFLIFREYVRLLRSCTIMCGKEVSEEFKPIFLDFFSGTRIELTKKCRNLKN